MHILQPNIGKSTVLCVHVLFCTNHVVRLDIPTQTGDQEPFQLKHHIIMGYVDAIYATEALAHFTHFY